ncbi:MAG: triose-phosphate isomerase [Clostridia bacterium]|nr:triose-phosphate isomerase [Clostridia bacterium]
MKKYVVAGNWKMNKLPSETAAFIKELALKVEGAVAEVVACVPYTSLAAAVEAAKGTCVKIGAQNLHFEDSGAFTGEVSADMLVDMDVEYVIIGHSERRQYFGETDVTVNKKVIKAIEKGLKPIVCVGESLEEREQGITIDLIRSQVKIAFMNVSAEDAAKCIIAYEPIWAIGTGKTATDEQANEVCAAIRVVVRELYGDSVADGLVIQYGGSVKPSNAAALFGMSDINGGLVGGASLKSDDFAGIVKF